MRFGKDRAPGAQTGRDSGRRTAAKHGSSMTAWEPAPFVKLLGVKIISRTAERSEAELFIRDDLCNRRNVMHGGAIMGWADTMGGMTTLAALPAGHRTATIESKTNFFAPIPEGDVAKAECTPLHRGRTTTVWQTKITRGDGKLAAIVTQTQLMMQKPGT
jgi:uncharacterized protein (TIGR00369 family)